MMHNKQRKTKSPKAETKLFNCNKNWCQVCLAINKANNFTSTVTRQSYKINHTFNCSDKFNRSDKCLICLLTSNKCLIQYVGKTVDEFHLRWNNYKNNFRSYNCNQSCIQTYLYEHYSSVGHFV